MQQHPRSSSPSVLQQAGRPTSFQPPSPKQASSVDEPPDYTEAIRLQTASDEAARRAHAEQEDLRRREAFLEEQRRLWSEAEERKRKEDALEARIKEQLRLQIEDDLQKQRERVEQGVHLQHLALQQRERDAAVLIANQRQQQLALQADA